jgi:CBS domain-containing protein
MENMTHMARSDPRGATTEYHDEYSEILGTESRTLQDALLSDTVSLLATREPIRLPETARIEEALEAMLAEDHVAVVVIDEEGRLSGIATDRDLLKWVRATDRDPGPTRLREAIGPDDRICSA